MELAIFKNPIPIKAIPEKKLNTLIMGDFLDWISAILSLNENATTKLEYALPAIKEHCWSMGFPEIKKMIEMYADGKLSVKPIPNHFDRIRFGEVVSAYKQQKPVKKKEIIMPEQTQEEKEDLIYHGLITTFDHYVQFKEVIHGKIWVHDHLDELGLIKLTGQEKQVLWNKALENCKSHAKANSDPLKAKTMLLELENKNASPRINEYKRLRMSKLFDVLIAKDKHLKDVL